VCCGEGDVIATDEKAARARLAELSRDCGLAFA